MTPDTHHDIELATEDRERGASLVDYALLLALIAMICLAGVTYLGGTAQASLENSGRSIAAWP